MQCKKIKVEVSSQGKQKKDNAEMTPSFSWISMERSSIFKWFVTCHMWLNNNSNFIQGFLKRIQVSTQFSKSAIFQKHSDWFMGSVASFWNGKWTTVFHDSPVIRRFPWIFVGMSFLPTAASSSQRNDFRSNLNEMNWISSKGFGCVLQPSSFPWEDTAVVFN